MTVGCVPKTRKVESLNQKKKKKLIVGVHAWHCFCSRSTGSVVISDYVPCLIDNVVNLGVANSVASKSFDW